MLESVTYYVLIEQFDHSNQADTYALTGLSCFEKILLSVCVVELSCHLPGQ